MAGNVSKYSVLSYNFLKEFVEEYYNAEELMRAAVSSRVHPDWIFTVPAADGVVRELNEGRIKLTVLGLGFDLRDGSLTFAILAHFLSPDFLKALKLDCEASWESASNNVGDPPIAFVALDDPRLRDFLKEEMDSSSIFAMDLAFRHLRAPLQAQV